MPEAKRADRFTARYGLGVATNLGDTFPDGYKQDTPLKKKFIHDNWTNSIRRFEGFVRSICISPSFDLSN